jgi:anthranilate phosphoribosyltransferase
VLCNLGVERAFVVHGMDGVDEISISGETRVSEVKGGAVSTYTVTPESFGFTRSPKDALAGGTPEENAHILRQILDGERGFRRDVIVLNAAFALTAAGIAHDIADGVVRAGVSIDSGMALKKMAELSRFTNTCRKETVAV